MVPVITAFADSPDGGEGQARDMRVRWALEEVGQPYDVRLVTFAEMKEPAHLARQPFGQIPSYEDGALVLFESGAIVLHLAERSAALMPGDAVGRARAAAWLFAALNTVEPPIVVLEEAMVVEADKPWFAARLPLLQERIRARLDSLSRCLGGAEWLEGEFSAGDLMMVMVLRRMDGMGLLEEYPDLAAYVARGEARPAFRRAFDAQRVVFESRHR